MNVYRRPEACAQPASTRASVTIAAHFASSRRPAPSGPESPPSLTSIASSDCTASIAPRWQREVAQKTRRIPSERSAGRRRARPAPCSQRAQPQLDGADSECQLGDGECQARRGGAGGVLCRDQNLKEAIRGVNRDCAPRRLRGLAIRQRMISPDGREGGPTGSGSSQHLRNRTAQIGCSTPVTPARALWLASDTSPASLTLASGDSSRT